MSDWYPVGVWLRHGCVMLLWLLSIYMNGIVRVVNVTMLSRDFSLINGDNRK